MRLGSHLDNPLQYAFVLCRPRGAFLYDVRYKWLCVAIYRVEGLKTRLQHQRPKSLGYAASIYSSPLLFCLCLLGIYDEKFTEVLLNSSFFEDLPKSVNDTWKERFQQNVTMYFKQSLIENIAKAAIRMLK